MHGDRRIRQVDRPALRRGGEQEPSQGTGGSGRVHIGGRGRRGGVPGVLCLGRHPALYHGARTCRGQPALRAGWCAGRDGTHRVSA